MPFLEKLKVRERAILYLTLAVLAISLLYNFIFGPIIERYRLINQEIISAQVKLQKYLHLLSQKDKITQEFAKISKEVKTKLSDEEEMALILSEIEDLSRRSFVHITQIKPQEPKKFSTYKEFPVEVRAEATVEGIAQFIYNLQNSPLLLRTKKLLLNTKPAATDTLEASILVVKISLP